MTSVPLTLDRTLSGPSGATGPALADFMPTLRYVAPEALVCHLGTGDLPGAWWWTVPITSAAGVLGRQELADRIAGLMIEAVSHLPLGDLFPALCLVEIDVAGAEHWPNPARNAVVAHAGGWRSLLVCSVRDMLDWSYVGSGKVRMIVTSVAHELLDRAIPGSAVPATVPADPAGRLVLVPAGRGPSPVTGESGLAQTPAEDRDAGQHGADKLAADLRLVAGWLAAAESPYVSVLPRLTDEGAFAEAPEDVCAAAFRLTAVTAGEAAGELMPAVPELLGEVVEQLEERQRAILTERLLAARPVTLDELGQRFAVTRERVRQVQVQLENRLRDWLRTPEAAPVRHRLQLMASELGMLATEAEVREFRLDHDALVEPVGVPAWQLLLLLDGLHEQGVRVRDGWVFRDDPDVLRDRTRKALAALHEQGPVSLEMVTSDLSDLGIRPSLVVPWLQGLRGFRVVTGMVVPWSTTIPDKIETVLRLAALPLEAEEITERIGEGHSAASVKNAMSIDHRFIRTGPRVYGLREWGGEAYLGIRELIEREIDRAGGEVRVVDLVALITQRYGLAESSVRVYAASPEFTRSGDGRIRRADRPASYAPRRSVAETRRCFRLDGIWCLRIDITSEHLRGSGFAVPSGFAANLGLVPGDRKGFPSEFGDLVATWRNQPVLGSIRRVLLALEAAAGDRLFVGADHDGRLCFQVVRQADVEAVTGIRRALLLAGALVLRPEEEPVAALARRLGMTAPVTADEVRAHLEHRGDRDVLECLGC